MKNVRLCDAILCQPSWSDELCVRCVREQYDNLLEQIDDCELLDDYYLFDDLSEYNREISEQLQDIENDLPF